MGHAGCNFKVISWISSLLHRDNNGTFSKTESKFTAIDAKVFLEIRQELFFLRFIFVGILLDDRSVISFSGEQHVPERKVQRRPSEIHGQVDRHAKGAYVRVPCDFGGGSTRMGIEDTQNFGLAEQLFEGSAVTHCLPEGAHSEGSVAVLASGDL
jgi:hypothetical protein